MQEKKAHSPLTNAAFYHPQCSCARNPTVTDRGSFALISTEHDIFVAYALTTTTAAASLIRATLRSWSHFRFRVARVPTWTSASRVSCCSHPQVWAGRSISTTGAAGAGSSARVRARPFERHEDPKSTTEADDPIVAGLPTARLMFLFGQAGAL